MEWTYILVWGLLVVSITLSLLFHNAVGKAIGKLAAKPFFGGANTGLGIFVGYLGSHFDKEIYSSLGRLYIPPAWTGGTLWIPGSLTYAPIFFWVLASLAVLGFAAALSAQGAAAAEVNEEFRVAFKKLFTMPSRGFLDVYSTFSLNSTRLTMEAPSTIKRFRLQKLIRAQLEAICEVVKAYDNDRVQFRYGCNIMLFIGSGTPTFAKKLPVLTASIRCIELGVSLQNLSGVLELQRSLSISSETGRLRDTSLRPFALPLPKAALPFDELNYIPGAPLAFASEKARLYRNQTDLIQKVDDNRRFSSTVLTDLVTTLQMQSESVQGLICIPLFDYYASSPGAIGVLNIHKNRTDDYLEDKYSNIGPLLMPMIRNLEKLLAIYPQ